MDLRGYQGGRGKGTAFSIGVFGRIPPLSVKHPVL